METANRSEGVFHFMRAAIANNLAGMIIIFIFYAAVFTAVNLIFGFSARGGAALAKSFLNFAATLSLISVLRPAFESGKLNPAAILPGLGFIGRTILFTIVSGVILFFLGLLIFVVWFSAGSVLESTFTSMISRDNIYFILALLIFINLVLTAVVSFCFISLSGKNGFLESVGAAFRILTENKLLAFTVFALLTTAITFLISFLVSHYSPGLLANAKQIAGKINGLPAFSAAKLKVAVIAVSALTPVYWIILMSVYFASGHDEAAEGELSVRGQYWHANENSPEEKPQSGGADDSFSLSNAFDFSWGIYKVLFAKLTAAAVIAHLVFIFIFAAVFMTLRQLSLIPDFFAGKSPSLSAIFILAAAMFVVYYAVTFFYVSFVRGFFKGEGLSFKNFFPPAKIIFGFFFFVVLMAAFLCAIPFVTYKAVLLLQVLLKGFNFSPAVLGAVPALLLASIALYALISLFYVPFLMLDGRDFSDSLAVCSEMTAGHRMALLGVLLLLAVLNTAGCAFFIGVLFTAPFSVLVLMQIYVTISSGYDGYLEDIANYR